MVTSTDIVDDFPLTFLVPHAVFHLLLDQKTHHLSAAYQLHYTTTLLEMPNICVQCCTVLNSRWLCIPKPGHVEEPCGFSVCRASATLFSFPPLSQLRRRQSSSAHGSFADWQLDDL